ncbi:MAG: MoaD family protein [Oscillospiraceae bacterium]
MKFFAYYRDITGRMTLNITGPETVGALLHELSDRFGPAFRKKSLSADGNDLGTDLILLVNGRNAVHIGGFNATLTDGDTVSIFPIVAGG